MNNSIEKKDFYLSFKKIALPVALQNLFFISLGLVDSLMVGSLGQVEYNGVGIGSQFFFIVQLFIVGISSACTIFSTQYFGNNDEVGFRKSAGLGIISSFITGLVCGLSAIFFPEFIIGLFSKETSIIETGALYLRIVGFQIPIASIVIPLAMASRSSQNAKLPLVISSISLLCNTTLNYLLIFGSFGFPKLGVAGAAIATLFASLVSLVMYLILIKRSKSPINGPFKDFIGFTKEFAVKVFFTGWTIIMHEVLWVLGISFFTLIISRNSSDSYTAYDIAVKFMRFSLIFSMSISSAASITIGNILGRKEIAKALYYEKLYSKTQIICSIIGGLISILLTFILIRFYNISYSVKEVTFYVAISITFFFPIKSYSGMQAAGILRAGGDTKIPVFLELFGNYFINIPILFFLLKYTNLELYFILFFASFGDILTAILLHKRVKKGEWANNLISEDN